METVSLAIRQARHFKSKYPDKLIMLKMGDFFECFEDDAQVLHDVLGLTLTTRSGVKMAGLPYHSVEPYLKKLLEHDYSVAVVEEVQGPASKVVKRDVVRFTGEGTEKLLE